MPYYCTIFIHYYTDGASQTDLIRAIFTGVELRMEELSREAQQVLNLDLQSTAWPSYYFPPESVALWTQEKVVQVVFGTSGEYHDDYYAEEKLMRFFSKTDIHNPDIHNLVIQLSYLNEQTADSLRNFWSGTSGLTVQLLWVYDTDFQKKAIMDLRMEGFKVAAMNVNKYTMMPICEGIPNDFCTALKNDIKSEAFIERFDLTQERLAEIEYQIQIWKDTVAAMFAGVLVQDKYGNRPQDVTLLLDIILDSARGAIPDGLDGLFDRMETGEENTLLLPQFVMAFKYKKRCTLKSFRSQKNGKHAEEYLLESYTTDKRVIMFLLSYSPCQHCTEQLINHFRTHTQKPIIKILRVYRDYPQGIKELNEAGFNIQVWDTIDYYMVFDKICSNFMDRSFGYCSILFQAMHSGALNMRDNFTQKEINELMK